MGEANEKEWNEEATYDERIHPLMGEILSICKERGIPMIAQFNYGHDGETPLLCTSYIPAGPFQRDDEEHMVKMLRVAKPPHTGILAITITTPKAASDE